MQFLNHAKILLLCASVAVVSSCGSRVETQVTLPPAEDLRVQTEPEYPVEALGEGPEAQVAEDMWWNDILAWGRTGWGNVERICQWSRALGKDVPAEWCE